MERLDQYRTHICVFVIGLTIITAGSAIFSYYYNPTYAQSVATNTAPSPSFITQLGVNGHSLDSNSPPYQNTSAAQQIAIVKSMGMTFYRIDCRADTLAYWDI
jgi:hypothetical protein